MFSVENKSLANNLITRLLIEKIFAPLLFALSKKPNKKRPNNPQHTIKHIAGGRIIITEQPPDLQNRPPEKPPVDFSQAPYPSLSLTTGKGQESPLPGNITKPPPPEPPNETLWEEEN